MTAQTRFRALGTYVVLSTADATELDLARDLTDRVLHDIDHVASRFRDDSELSWVNANTGSWVEVSPLLVMMVQAALLAADESGGLVNPLVGSYVQALGYDRDFELLGAQISRGATALPEPAPNKWREIELDDGAIRIPADTALDLGATGKAFAVDLLAVELANSLSSNWCLSIGGEIRTQGTWPIAVSTTPDGPVAQTVDVTDTAVATSSTAVRKWRDETKALHHLIDPRTGQPADDVWHTVTTLAATCLAANTAALTAILLGEKAPHWLVEQQVPARLAGRDGRVVCAAGWPEQVPA